MFDADARKAIGGIAKGLSVEPAALLAVAEVESAGVPFAYVNGRPMPLIRWECHYFHRLLPPALKQSGMAAGLAHPVAGYIGNPASQQARYAMLERAEGIDYEAAVGSCSWGLGQVMGAHWKNLGYSSPQQFVQVACSGIAGQTEIMARFIARNGLVPALRARNWKAFARAYNGPAYAMNRYDEKMGRAYVRYLSGRPPPGPMSPVLTNYVPGTSAYKPEREDEFSMQAGFTGPAVQELQSALLQAGIFLYPDGHYGTNTLQAVMEFQRRHGLPADGRVDAKTREALAAAQADAAAPWWSKRTSGSTQGQAAPKAKPQAWWQAEDKKVWWEG